VILFRLVHIDKIISLDESPNFFLSEDHHHTDTHARQLQRLSMDKPLSSIAQEGRDVNKLFLVVSKTPYVVLTSMKTHTETRNSWFLTGQPALSQYGPISSHTSLDFKGRNIPINSQKPLERFPLFEGGNLVCRKEFSKIWKTLKDTPKEDQAGFYLYDHWFVVDSTPEVLSQALKARNTAANNVKVKQNLALYETYLSH